MLRGFLDIRMSLTTPLSINLPSKPQAHECGGCCTAGFYPLALTNAAMKSKANYNYRLEPRPLPDQACPFLSPVDYSQHCSVL